MPWTEQQYERVARYLDGESVELTARQRELAEEIRAGRATVTAGIDPRMSRRAIDKARRRMSAELARPRRRKISLACLAAAEAVAVAAVLIIALTLQPMATPETDADNWAEVPLEVIGPDGRSEIAQRISLVRQGIDLIEADILSPAAVIDPAGFEIDELRYELEGLLDYQRPEFYLEG